VNHCSHKFSTIYVGTDPKMAVVIEDQASPCCGNAPHRIGEDRSERVDIIPAQLRVIVVRRPK
jgi:transposase